MFNLWGWNILQKKFKQCVPSCLR